MTKISALRSSFTQSVLVVFGLMAATGVASAQQMQHGSNRLQKPIARTAVKAAATIKANSVISGLWSDPQTWGGTVPTGAVVIPDGQTVYLDMDVALANLQIEGTLIFLDDRDQRLSADWIMIHGGGKLQVGTQAQPFNHRATITLTGNNQDENIMGMGTKALCAMMGGTLELYGQPHSLTWTKLTATTRPGERQIQLEQAVDWQEGDKIVVAPSDFNPHEAEEVTVKSVNGQIITIEQPLGYQHWGEMQQYGQHQLDERAEVGLLSHNIVVQGDAGSVSTRFGGHTMIMNGSHARVQGVEFRQMGQEGRLGRYGFHWHLAGNNRGDFFNDNSLHHLFSRGVVVHGASNIHLKGNVLYDFRGHGFSLEDGVENGNVFESNLGLLARIPDVQPNPDDNTDMTPAVFWIKNPNNTFRNNVAAGSESQGFWYELPEHPTGPSANNNIWPREARFGEFINNVSHSNMKTRGETRDGTGVWVDGDNSTRRAPASSNRVNKPSLLSESRAAQQAVFKNLTVYKNQNRGAWLNSEFVVGAKFADNRISIVGGNSLPTIEKSLVACLSANSNPQIGIPTGPGDWGDMPYNAIEMYDGNMRLRDNTFANCREFTGDGVNRVGGVIGLSINKGGNGTPYTTFTNSQMINSIPAGFKPAYEYNSDDLTEPKRTIVFRDTDGTLTGTNQPSVIVYNNPLQLTNDCQPLDVRTRVCPGANNYLTVLFSGLNGAKAYFRRDDGAFSPIQSWVAPNGGQLATTNVLAGTGYTASSTNSLPSHFGVEIFGERAGQWVRLSLPFPYAQAFVYPVFNYSNQVTRVNSMSALNASSDPAAYFLDTNSNLIHLKMQTTSNMFQPIMGAEGVFHQYLTVCEHNQCQQ